MRKQLISAVIGVAALGGSALAADALDPARLQFGLGLNLVPSLGSGVVAEASFNNLFNLAPGINLGARANLGLSLSNPVVGALTLTPVVTFDIANGGIYVGPSLGVGLGGADASVGLGLRGGIEYDLSNEVMIYGYTGLSLGTSTLTGNTAVGIDLELSEPVSAFGETRVIYGGGNATFGLALGLNYAFR